MEQLSVFLYVFFFIKYFCAPCDPVYPKLKSWYHESTCKQLKCVCGHE